MNKEKQSFKVEKILKLESENRILSNKLNDLEFQIEELEIINENDNDAKPPLSQQKNLESGDNSTHDVIINRRKKELLAMNNSFLKLLNQRKNEDIEFLKMEINELHGNNSQVETMQFLSEQYENKQREIVTNAEQIQILQNEEKAALFQISSLEEALNLKGDYKHPPSNWMEERESIREKLQNAQHRVLDATEEHAYLEEKVKELMDNPINVPDSNVDDLKKALNAEILFSTTIKERHIQLAIEAEEQTSKILQKELDETMKATNIIKTHREKSFERQKKQYDIASSQQRLKVLQNELEKLMEKNK